MKKLLAMALVGGLFSLGCTENATKPTPKDKPAPSKMKTMGGEGKDEAAPKTKDEADKKDEKKDETKKEESPKKDADKKDKK